MKYLTDFRDASSVALLAKAIRTEAADRTYRIMEFCGGHTYAIYRHGLDQLLPDTIRLIHGPGCPVCVLPAARVARAIELAKHDHCILAVYGDMLRVPGPKGRSLAHEKAAGADVRIVYSADETIALARDNPDADVVFFAIGFETTTPHTAVLIEEANRTEIHNLSVCANHLVTPAALQAILDFPAVRDLGGVTIDAFIGPGHVAAVIGTEPFRYFAFEYGKPIVLSGFEPCDLLLSILMAVRQINAQTAVVENEYRRVITASGNLAAQRAMQNVFELAGTFMWRGLGTLPYSSLRIRSYYASYDADKRYPSAPIVAEEPPDCQCGAVIRGERTPRECVLFGTRCTPEDPVGACMVSGEGACGAYYRYGR